jgi:hypothetical protein
MNALFFCVEISGRGTYLIGKENGKKRHQSASADSGDDVPEAFQSVLGYGAPCASYFQ